MYKIISSGQINIALNEIKTENIIYVVENEKNQS